MTRTTSWFKTKQNKRKQSTPKPKPKQNNHTHIQINRIGEGLCKQKNQKHPVGTLQNLESVINSPLPGKHLDVMTLSGTAYLLQPDLVIKGDFRTVTGGSHLGIKDVGGSPVLGERLVASSPSCKRLGPQGSQAHIAPGEALSPVNCGARCCALWLNASQVQIVCAWSQE